MLRLCCYIGCQHNRVSRTQKDSDGADKQQSEYLWHTFSLMCQSKNCKIRLPLICVHFGHFNSESILFYSHQHLPCCSSQEICISPCPVCAKSAKWKDVPDLIPSTTVQATWQLPKVLTSPLYGQAPDILYAVEKLSDLKTAGNKGVQKLYAQPEAM